jgi:hypothetical protein
VPAATRKALKGTIDHVFHLAAIYDLEATRRTSGWSTSGIGLESAKQLAARGATVLLVARSRENLDFVVHRGSGRGVGCLTPRPYWGHVEHR